MWRAFVVSIAVLISGAVWGSSYSLSLPLVYEQNPLGELPVEINGMALERVSVDALQDLLGTRVSPEWWSQFFGSEPSTFVDIETLAERGIEVTLNTESLFIDVRLSAQILSEQDITLSSGYPDFIPSESGSINWLNSFSFAYNNYWQEDVETWDSSLDWLSQGNIGGASGVNFLLANYLEADNETTKFSRGEWIAFYDDPNLPMRASTGDVISGESGHIYGMSLGGFSIESRYADLQPDRETSPESSQQLVLLESAEVEVYVNGERISGGRLEPGRYNLKNLILDNGANDITVVVNYVSGKQEVLRFTQFYNAKLLKKGLIDYSFSVGQPIIYDNRQVEYEEEWVATGYLEYGVTDWLTAGANGLYAQDGSIFGALFTFKSGVGNVTARYSLSSASLGEDGWIASLDYENSIFGSGESQSPNLRFAIEKSDDFQNKPWKESQEGNSYTQYLANYFWQINSKFDLTLTGRLTQLPPDDDELRGSVLLNWRHGGFTVGVGSEYEESERYNEPDTRFLFTFEYNWYSDEHGNRIGLSYNSENERSRAYFSNEGLNYVGDYGVRIEAEQDEFRDTQRAQLSYTANRFRAESEVSRDVVRKEDTEQYQASLRLATAVGMVDGDWGWGRATSGPFVVAEMHPTLGEATANLDVDSQGRPTAMATKHLNGLVSISQPYARYAMDYNVMDSPVGYDWGDGKLELMPAAATGYLLTIGSDASYTASGYLKRLSGEPIEYRQGRVLVDDEQIEFFTNKQGRFFIQGLRPGIYTVELYGLQISPVVISIPESDTSLIDLGEITVMPNNDK
ncbi:fimbria/pilus outer membrane usher protein [Vibrio harveyi]|uniref:fimbria/pilus outer membrane usher protein n=1 Tax=Vibrio harveyi TaxID=669 RepID=UPI002380A202|nr:fimbria/pilus outer membrane usher protein [Vibrio harveyi]